MERCCGSQLLQLGSFYDPYDTDVVDTAVIESIKSQRSESPQSILKSSFSQPASGEGERH
jgi:hypothetical protein